MKDLSEYKRIRTNIQGVVYYLVVMRTKSGKSYYSHVFFTEELTEKELSNRWKSITVSVAVRYQSKTKEDIERNNYYICFFTSEEIEDSLRETIEGDDFCARKYIINQKYQKESDALEIINEKLFDFSNEEVLRKSGNNLYFKSLTLQNFRVYEKSRQFEFFDDQKRVAPFVLFYAKNGVGKTSIFDGVEFLLKGEVARIENLESLNTKSKNTNVVYHNLRHPNEDASVSAILTNNRLLKRRVSKTVNGNDRKRTAVRDNEGKDIIGTGKKQLQWKDIILPYDSIDSFITSNKPEDIYKAWIASSNLQVQSDNFLKKHRELKGIENQLDDNKVKENQLQEELGLLQSCRENVDTLIQLIQEFNEIKEGHNYPEGEKLCLKLEDNVTAYNEFLNQVEKYLREINEYKYKVHNPQKTELDKIFTIGWDYYIEKHIEFENTKKKLEEIENRFKRKRLFDGQERKLELNTEQKAELDRERRVVRSIIKMGEMEGVRNKEKRIFELQKLDDGYDDEEKKHSDRIESLVQKLAKLSGDIEATEATLNDDVKRLNVIYIAEQYIAAKKALSQYNSDIAAIEDSIAKIEKAVTENEKENDNLAAIRLSGEISESSFDSIQRVGSLLGFDKIQEIQNVIHQYKQLKSQINDIEISIKENSKHESNLNKLIIKYLADHPDSCDCPVCGNHFQSHKELYEAIIDLDKKKQRELLDTLAEKRHQGSEVEDQYAALLSILKKSVFENIKQFKNEINCLIKDRDNKTNELKEIQSNRDKCELGIKEMGLTLCQYGEQFSVDPISTIEGWYKEKERLLDSLQRQSEEAKQALKEIKEEGAKCKKKHEAVKTELASLTTDPVLQTAIEYCSKKDDKWSSVAYLGDLNQKADMYDKAREKLLEEYQKDESLQTVSIDSLTEEKDLCEESLKGIQEDNSTYLKYSFQDTKDLIEKQNELNKREETLNKEEDLLHRMLEENNAKSYFEEYATKLKEKEELEDNLKKLKADKKNLKKEYNDMRAGLENDLKDYFDYTMMNNVYRKIDPHKNMKIVKYSIAFSPEDKPQLFISASDGMNEIRPEWYFSTAQLNTLAFSSFFSKAIKSDLAIKTIFIDDPISHFDDMNILGFADMMRSFIMETPYQVIMSTHDRKIYEILKRKLPTEFYRSMFIEL